MQRAGKVYLVGAGPGDPGLLTLKAYELLQNVDVVVYDRLVSSHILELIKQGISQIPVGKASGYHSVPQDEINSLLVSLARGGRKVVRLKGGDPFIFGRGSEEALYLKQHQIRFEVVPGVTAAVACSAYAGVPLTHRGLARKAEFMTGHFQKNQPIDLGDGDFSERDRSLVIYMGLSNLGRLSQQLITQGMDPSTPAMAIQEGTLPSQRTLVSSLIDLEQAVCGAGFHSPVLLVIGQTVSLARQLAWFTPDTGHVERIDATSF